MNHSVADDTVIHAPVLMEWAGEARFQIGRPGGTTISVDGDAQSAPSPFDLLLGAIAACASTDVVTILKKRRTPVQALGVRVEAQRVAATPRRLMSAVLHFTIRGEGIERAHAERAVDLAVTKYCSVRSSLAADVDITWTIEL